MTEKSSSSGTRGGRPRRPFAPRERRVPRGVALSWPVGAAGLALGLAVLLSAAGSRGASAQEPEVVPTVPAGTPVVLLPVQSARPTLGGAWPGGAVSMQDALRTLEAELAFAFGEAEAPEWVMPEEVAERSRRNPLARVDPRRLAYHGLLRKPDPRVQLYEPLHGQLRMLSAMFGARLVVLPLALWYEPGTPLSSGEADGPGGPPREAEGEGYDTSEMGEDTAQADGRRSEAEHARTSAEDRGQGRAVLLLAVVDTRRSAVLWHGTMEGEPGPATSRQLLTTLALKVAGWMAP